MAEKYRVTCSIVEKNIYVSAEYYLNMTENLSSGNPREFPSDDEIPENPLKADDIDPFNIDDENVEDIDEFTAAEWKSQSTSDERILTIIKRTRKPKTASEIADTALVSDSDARKILNELAEEGIIRIYETDCTKLYCRDSY